MALNLINRKKGNKAVNLVELYEKFVDSSSEAFFMFDKNLFAIGMNDVAANLNGIKNVKKTGADIKEILPNMYDSNRFDQLRDVIRTGKPFRFRDYIHKDDETPKLFEISAFKVGAGLGVVALDLSKRNTKVETLESMDSFSSAIQSVIHNPFVVLDSENRVLKANRSFYDHFILKPVDVVNQHIYDLGETQWNIKGLHELLDYKISTNGSAKNYEIVGYFTGLGERNLRLNAKQYEILEEGRKLTLLAFNDVTEIARQRDTLKKLTAIYAKSPDPIVITNDRGDITEMNAEAIKLYGWSATEILDKSFKTILAPETREGYDNLLEGVLGGMAVRDVETKHWTKKGEVIPVVMAVQLVKDQHDENMGTIAFMQPVTSQKKAEDALIHLQEVLILSTDPVAIMDLDGKVIDFNEAAEAAFSRQKESTVGKEGHILVCPEDQDKYTKAFAGCLEGLEGRNIEIQCITRTGVLRATQLSFNLLMDARNEPTAMSVVERRKSGKDKAIRAYNHLLESFLEIPEPVVVEDLNGEVVNLNRLAVNFYGWKKIDLVGKSSKNLIPKGQHDKHEDFIKHVKNGEFIRNQLSTRWSKAGSTFNVNLTMFMVLNTNEEPEFIITIAKPLDGGLGLGNSDALDLDIIYQDSLDPIIIEDLSGKVLQMNVAAENLLGWKAKEIIGKPMRNIIPADKHKLHEKILLLIQNNVPIKRVESKLWSKRGEVFPVAVSLLLIKNASGEPVAIASINQDMNLLKNSDAGKKAGPI